MKISDYVPKLYENNLDMNSIINTEEIELEIKLKPSIDESFNNTFPIRTNEKGIELYETMLNIYHNPTDSLNLRRNRIISRLTNTIPFSEKYMINRLNEILGEGNWNYELDYNNYTLTVNCLSPGRSWYIETLTFLENTIPCNINWELNLYEASWNLVKEHFASWNSLTDMNWQAVLDGEWSLE